MKFVSATTTLMIHRGKKLTEEEEGGEKRTDRARGGEGERQAERNAEEENENERRRKFSTAARVQPRSVQG